MKIVKKYSLLYSKLKELNAKYCFDNNIEREYQYVYDCGSKRQYDSSEIHDFFLETLEENINNIKNIITRIDNNNILYSNYLRDYKMLKSKTLPMESNKYKFKINCNECLAEINNKVSKFYTASSKNINIKVDKISTKMFHRIEEKLYNDNKLPVPRLETSIKCIITYTSPQGRNHYERTNVYSYPDIKYNYNYVVDRLKNRSTREYQIQLERSKMSASLRYEVLRRDNYKCQICGLSANDGVVLHVDHIIPISKGGRTVLSNLQTLCDRCNFGKSNKI